MSEPTPSTSQPERAERDETIPSSFGPAHQIARVIWGVVWALLFRPSLRPMHGWRRMLLRLFGAKLAAGVHVYPRARVWAPWNLRMDEHACLSDDVDCYCVAPVHVGRFATVSQHSQLCAATHDHEDPGFALQPAPIVIGESVWVCADVFVGPGVTIGEGSVVGARSSVFTDLPAWKVCVGSPARPIKDRIIRRPAGDHT